MRRLCVYCGSAAGTRPEYRAAAVMVGSLLAARGIGLVYGGGHVGMMGAVADAVLRAGGEVLGIIPRGLADREVAHLGLTELRVVGSMHERKAMMADLADGFLTLPGGVGTLEELAEIWTWAQLGIHTKPIGILNVAGYFTPLLSWADHAVTEGFVRPPHRDMLIVDTDPAALLARMEAYRPIVVEKWMRAGET